MNNENLKRYTSQEAREYGAKGGRASGKKRAERKQLKEYLEAMLKIKDEHTGLDNATLITLGLLKAAEEGNPKAYEVIRDTLGEKPKEEIAISNIEITINED